MPSDHLVDPALRPALDAMPAFRFSADSLPLIRTAMRQAFASTPVPDGLAVSVEERQVPGPAGAPSVRLLVYRPQQATQPMPALLHIHGGGYVIGTPDISGPGHRKLAAELGCVLVSVDYRLAPETPHPGPIEDCYAALAWLHRSAGELGIDTARIGVTGESAGGGLAAALCLLARDRGEWPIAFQHLIYPMIDDRTGRHDDPHPHTGEYVWTHETNRFGWAALLGDAVGTAEVSPYAAAARAQDLHGLPPAFIAVGALDLFLDEDLDYARRLTRAGVPVELHVYPGAFHGFQLAAGAPVAIAAERDSRNALSRLLGG